MTREVSQRVAVVTGASAGVGKSTARMFAERGWHVIGIGRDPARSTAAEAEIRAAAASGARIDFLRGDFDLMTEVRRVADEITRITSRVDVLVNNAGGVRDRLIMTAEGNEAIFASNHLAPFLLTLELMPLLKNAATMNAPGAVRVLAVSSSGHEYSPLFDWDDLQSLTAYTPGLAYCRAKLANILFTRELTRRVAANGITAQAMHPGNVASNFHSHADEAMRAHSRTQERFEPDEPA
jgi:NAD(P)-dependent dehydrogenase (short-subunit alcohol dehydrogenase family)